MAPSLREQSIYWLHKPYIFDGSVWVLSLLTQLLIWFNDAKTLPLTSLQVLWQSAHQPQTTFQWLLSPIAHNDTISVCLMALFSSLSLWLFCRIARLIGLSKIVTFALFLLLNFNPEYNDVRLDVDPFQLVMPLWLLSVWLFIYWYQYHIYRAFLAWAITLWLGALLSPYPLIWALFFPLCFIVWPGRSFHWWQGLLERGKFLLAYYVIIAIIGYAVPFFREEVLSFSRHAIEQFRLVSGEISLFLSVDSSFSLSGFDGFLLSLVLVIINALKVAGLLIVIFVWLAFVSYRQGVLTGRVRLFFAFCLAFSLIYAALNLLYLGHLQSDLLYTPITMLLLWLNASGVFFVVDRWRYGHIKAERQLFVFWLFVAYALASIIAFGPSADYKKAAGEWSQTQSYATLYSNDAQTLYYAGLSPMPDNQHQFHLEYQRPETIGLSEKDLILHIQSRHRQLPRQLEDYEVLATFANRHGDQIFALTLKP